MTPRRAGRPIAELPIPEDAGKDAGRAGPVAPAAVWLLKFAPSRRAALPADSVLEAVARPRIIGVPGAPYCALGMLAWRGRYLAVLDLASLLDARPKEPGPSPSPGNAVIVACRTGPDRPIDYAAIAAVGPIAPFQVTDAMQCPLPEDSDLWPLIAASCFTHQGQALPLIDTGKLFTAHWD